MRTEYQTNVSSYLASLLPDRQQTEQARLRAQLDKGDSQLFFHQGNPVTGFQLLKTDAVSDDEIAITIFVGGHDSTMKLVAKHIGDAWRMYSAPTF